MKLRGREINGAAKGARNPTSLPLGRPAFRVVGVGAVFGGSLRSLRDKTYARRLYRFCPEHPSGYIFYN